MFYLTFYASTVETNFYHPSFRSCFTYTLQLVRKFSDNNNPPNLYSLLQGYHNSIGQQCCSTLDELRNLLISPIRRWLGRVDSLPSYIDRRCIAVAAITCFRQGTQSYNINDHQLLDVKYLEDLAVNDSWHAQWLEPVINLIIQVCNYLHIYSTLHSILTLLCVSGRFLYSIFLCFMLKISSSLNTCTL